jgi:hypothetical protein
MSRILDISKGGISLLLLDGEVKDISKKLFLNILLTKPFFESQKIDGEIAWEHSVCYSSISGMVYKKIGINFSGLSNTQKDQLDRLIMTCARVAT